MTATCGDCGREVDDGKRFSAEDRIRIHQFRVGHGEFDEPHPTGWPPGLDYGGTASNDGDDADADNQMGERDGDDAPASPDGEDQATQSGEEPDPSSPRVPDQSELEIETPNAVGYQGAGPERDGDERDDQDDDADADDRAEHTRRDQLKPELRKDLQPDRDPQEFDPIVRPVVENLSKILDGRLKPYGIQPVRDDEVELLVRAWRPVVAHYWDEFAHAIPLLHAAVATGAVYGTRITAAVEARQRGGPDSERSPPDAGGGSTSSDAADEIVEQHGGDAGGGSGHGEPSPSEIEENIRARWDG